MSIGCVSRSVKVAACCIGDQIDARYQSQMEEIIELTGSPETAYTTFLYVVENLFNWDENGRGESSL